MTPQAASQLAPDVPVDPVPPYMTLSGGLVPGTEIPPPGAWTADTAREMHEQMIDAVADWHPALRGLVERIARDTLFAAQFKRLDPTPAWETSNVTVIGDAIHAMLPTLGMGGNASLRDAAILAERLAAVQRGEAQLVPAVAAYEEAMHDYVDPIMELSADHDRFGGGGLRKAPRHDPAGGDHGLERVAPGELRAAASHLTAGLFQSIGCRRRVT